jgi:hypothetical protein
MVTLADRETYMRQGNTPGHTHTDIKPGASLALWCSATSVNLPEVSRLDHQCGLSPQEVDLLIKPVCTIWAQLEIEVPCKMCGDDAHLVISQTDSIR